MLSSAAPVLALDAPVMIKEKADAQHLKNPTAADAAAAEQPGQEAEDASVSADAGPADDGIDAEQPAQGAEDASAAVDASPADDAIATA